MTAEDRDNSGSSDVARRAGERADKARDNAREDTVLNALGFAILYFALLVAPTLNVSPARPTAVRSVTFRVVDPISAAGAGPVVHLGVLARVGGVITEIGRPHDRVEISSATHTQTSIVLRGDFLDPDRLTLFVQAIEGPASQRFLPDRPAAVTVAVTVQGVDKPLTATWMLERAKGYQVTVSLPELLASASATSPDADPEPPVPKSGPLGRSTRRLVFGESRDRLVDTPNWDAALTPERMPKPPSEYLERWPAKDQPGQYRVLRVVGQWERAHDALSIDRQRQQDRVWLAWFGSANGGQQAIQFVAGDLMLARVLSGIPRESVVPSHLFRPATTSALSPWVSERTEVRPQIGELDRLIAWMASTGTLGPVRNFVGNAVYGGGSHVALVIGGATSDLGDVAVIVVDKTSLAFAQSCVVHPSLMLEQAPVPPLPTGLEAAEAAGLVALGPDVAVVRVQDAIRVAVVEKGGPRDLTVEIKRQEVEPSWRWRSDAVAALGKLPLDTATLMALHLLGKEVWGQNGLGSRQDPWLYAEAEVGKSDGR